MTKKPADPEDAALFAEAMRDVKPARSPVHVTLDGRVLSTRPRQQELDDAEVLKELLLDPEPDLLESGDTLSYKAPGVQDSVMRKLRRGHYRIERELDLHGLNRNDARLEVSRFLLACRDQGIRGARIIHGKGRGSPNSGPVIKSLLDGWLRKHRDVMAFTSARPADGGTGAIYVLLRAQ